MRHRTSLAGLVALAFLLQPAIGPVAKARPATTVVQHQRLLPLEGGRNFRDLGGYRTTDGHSVKWGLLFRSGSMHGLTARDYTYLDKIGIKVVCDFRDNRERAGEPVPWPAAQAPAVLSDDYSLADTGLMPKGDIRAMTTAQARAMLASSYPRMLTFFADQYRRMFAELLAGHAPLAFNCSAGKDRTGIAAALLLTALGVPRETVIQDYLLTNRYLDSKPVLAQQSKSGANAAWAQLSPSVMAAFMAADRSYIEAALQALDKHPGGARGYFHDEMKLSDADIAKLGRMYLM
jgi:protein-tyrosine phosphatase